jgi:phosphatidate phosphatase APP1
LPVRDHQLTLENNPLNEPKIWTDEVSKLLRQSIDNVDDYIDARWRWLRKKFGTEGVPQIVPYIGFANDERAWLHGRVLTNPPLDLPSADDNWWDNLQQTYRRLESDEVVGAEIEIDFNGQTHSVTTDEEGYFHLESAWIPQPSSTTSWLQVPMRIVNSDAILPAASTTIGRLLAPPATANLGVISDIDDTVMFTGVTDLTTMIRLTFLHNARTRKPLAGVDKLFQALKYGSGLNHSRQNPIFYISSSPWNLFDLLEHFFELNNIPEGPILLRDLGFDANKFIKEGHEHKLEKARRVLKAYPDLPFVLFGDSGEDDAQLYAQAAAEFPDQIKAIFIRDVDPGSGSHRDESVNAVIEAAKPSHAPMYLIQDSAEADIILRDMGFIS